MSVPFNIDLLPVDEFIKENDVKEVTSNLITEPGTDQFHPDGLYSEDIFGPVTDKLRLSQFGYIDLHTEVIHPKVYNTLLRWKRFFGGIMEGEQHAIFDPEAGMFIKAAEDDEDADTGYAFFMSHLKELKFEKTGSVQTDNRMEMLEKFRDMLTISKQLVIPAGLRDYKMEASGRESSEEVNKFYNALLNYARAVDTDVGNDPMLDSVRMAMQKKVWQIYDYLQNILSGPQGGKKGFLQKKYGARNMALGARNVISAAQFQADGPDDSRFQDVDVTKVPLVVVNTAFKPLVVYYLRHYFFNHIMTAQHEQASLINPETYELEFHDVDDSQKDLYTTSDGADKLINLFKNVRFRNKPVSMLDKDNKQYYLALVYDDGDRVIIARNKRTFTEEFKEAFGSDPDLDNLRPMTYTEMFYVAAYEATLDKFINITRDPAIEMGSSYISKVYVMTTSRSRKVNLVTLGPGDHPERELPEWPVPDEDFVDSTIIHPSRLEGLGGDYDGDQVHDNSIMNDASVEECKEFMNSKGYALDPSGDLSFSIKTDVTKLVFHNFSLMEEE